MNKPKKVKGPRRTIRRGAKIQPWYQKPPNALSKPMNAGLTIQLLNGSKWPKVYITAVAHSKMRALVQECELEIGWLCSCYEAENGDVVIDDVFVPGQVCSVSTTEITEDGEAQMLQELIASGAGATIGRLWCWGHSHVNMPVFASGPDEDQTQEFLERNHPFFIRLIANKRDDLFCSLYLNEANMALHNAPLEIEPAQTEDYLEWARGEIEAKVARRVITVQYYMDFGTEFGFEEIDQGMLEGWFNSGLIDQGVLNYFQRPPDGPVELEREEVQP